MRLVLVPRERCWQGDNEDDDGRPEFGSPRVHRGSDWREEMEEDLVGGLKLPSVELGKKGLLNFHKGARLGRNLEPKRFLSRAGDGDDVPGGPN